VGCRGIQVRSLTVAVLLALCPCAHALNPSLDINQYAHNAWTIREGFFKGPIESIAQTPDGYLWLATESGLLRFDGVRTVRWQPPAGEHLPGGSIRSLLAARDGRLWIGTAQGLASWKDGKLTHYSNVTGQCRPLLEDREGTVWVGGFVASTGRLCAIQSGGTHCYGADGSFGREVISLYEDSRGYLWAGSFTGVWRWKPGPPKLYRTPDLLSGLMDGVSGLMEGDDRGLLIVMRHGIRRLVDGKGEVYRFPGGRRPLQPIRIVSQFKNVSKSYGSKQDFSGSKLLRDRNGGLWIGTTDGGVLHVHQGRTDQFARSDGLSGDFIHGLFEDREGNVWVVTGDGLDRFRDFAIPTISVEQGLSNGFFSCVMPARDGTVWIGTRDGLNRWNDGEVTIYRRRNSGLPDDVVESVFEDIRGRIWVSTGRGIAYFENGRFTRVSDVPSGHVHSIAGDGIGNLWLNQEQSLFHLRGGAVVERIPWARLQRSEAPRALLLDPIQGGLWLGFSSSLVYFKDGQIRMSYSRADGLGEGRVTGLQLDGDGTLWAATEGGLSRVKNGHIATLNSKNGLPCDTVHGVVEDDDHSLWLHTGCGFVRITRPELDAWVREPKRMIQVRVFDGSDGVSVYSLPFSGRVAKSSDGRIWFLPLEGVSVIDPRHLPVNKLPPPLQIEQIIADRKTYDPSSNLRLPPLVRDLEIDYTALSLVAPEKNRFRVKLEGRDPDWKAVGNERKAFYNDLPPRNYRFRVAASNNSGVWNEAGASLDFSIAPAYYQTVWFRASCAAAILGLLWALYRYRLHQIAQEFNARMEERINERTRIARELHDTLLQSFQGLMLRFQVAHDELPASPAEARTILANALDEAAQAIAEGRDAVQGLRSSTVETNDLARAIGSLGQELAGDETNSNRVASCVEVEGTPRDVHPILRDEIYRIAGEALRNAFRHAHARRLQVAIEYGERQFRLRVRDDGKGIDPELVGKQGRAGHWGLAGMRERAVLIGGNLEIRSQRESGTEVELSIPASIAYATSRARRRSRLFTKVPFAKKTGTKS
jgi:signal transduction histidine kinase/ligand-binding sensor domain-containing protein